MRYKVDEYVVYHKGKKHSVLVFPFVKYMWAFDDWHEEDCFMVDGTVEAISMLKYAMAILVEASDKILYFPCKQEGLGRYYNDNYNLVLCTPKAQLKRSSWIAIRRKLKPQNKIGSYVLQYNRKKLDDYCNNKLIERKYYGEREHIYLREEVRKEIKRKHFEDIMGENLFVVMSKEECCYAHFITAKDLDEYHAGYDYGAWSYLGWIITQKGLCNMKKEMEEEMKKEALAFLAKIGFSRFVIRDYFYHYPANYSEEEQYLGDALMYLTFDSIAPESESGLLVENGRKAFDTIVTNDIPKLYICASWGIKTKEDIIELNEWINEQIDINSLDMPKRSIEYDDKTIEEILDNFEKARQERLMPYIEKMGNCELICLGGDHMIYEQKPIECGEMIKNFIDGLDN